MNEAELTGQRITSEEQPQRIRRAQEEDIPELHRLLLQVNMVHHQIRPDLFRGPATKYTDEELKALIRKTEDPIFVFPGSDGQLSGYIFCKSEEVKETSLRTGIRTLYIDDLCVDEACRGKHVGQQLYHHALSYAKENHYYNVTLHVWGGNEGAEKFYTRMGLRPQYTCLEAVISPRP